MLGWCCVSLTLDILFTLTYIYYYPIITIIIITIIIITLIIITIIITIIINTS